jgi:hypothetical protein
MKADLRIQEMTKEDFIHLLAAYPPFRRQCCSVFGATGGCHDVVEVATGEVD